MVSGGYIPGGKWRHPALSNREVLVRTMERYDVKPRLAAKSMGCSAETIIKALHKLAPDKVVEWKQQGKLTPGYSRGL